MASDAGLIQIEVIAAWPGQVWRRTVHLPGHSTVADALEASSVLEAFPELGSMQAMPPVGIFGRACAHDQELRSGDRLEVYRPLVFDPMESRRRRAEHRKRSPGAVPPAGR